MNPLYALLHRMFARPRGRLGRLGGRLMASSSTESTAWTLSLLDPEPADSVLEIGFGPGLGVESALARVFDGHVVGVDPSRPMVEQAAARNEQALATGRTSLCRGDVEALPFEADTFECAFSTNSMQVWPDAQAGLKEIRRVCKPDGTVALSFSTHSGLSRDAAVETVSASELEFVDVVETADAFCVLGRVGDP
ncbi:class I SAM-dependent methyltransferase [Haladaptatus sp. GCM10025707]|uniref:class I SAM-dependent methyltransferase n=1 Tax=unclassified Haladaptatus TaxID=2622732 RepID=UPI0023E7FD7A|nr:MULTISPECIES: class I SAM-dependent methyltransferase [unclassified Haladaptatus]